MRMLNNSELEFVSGGLAQNPNGSINGSFGPLAKYIYQLTGASTSGVTGESTSGGDALDTVDVIAQRDYCGNTYLNVPDLWYREACMKHDKNSSEDSNMSRLEADLNFLRDMISKDLENGQFGRHHLAILYFLGVRLGGWTTYEGGN